MSDERQDAGGWVNSRERALQVREWRCGGEGGTWRWVAEQAHAAWGGDWSPPSNQLAGQALCLAAADLLGEDGNEEPWN